jgi:hypothetical protein
MFLALSCPILLMAAGFAGWKKTVPGIILLAAASLTCESFAAEGSPQQKHTVVLRWKASSTMDVRYNIYRGSAPGVHPDKLNAVPVDGLSFPDSNVQSGKKYYYVVRSVNAAGRESSDSNEALATIP